MASFGDIVNYLLYLPSAGSIKELTGEDLLPKYKPIYSIDVVKWYENIVFLYDSSKSDTLKNTRLYLYFIYVLILAQQTFLQKIKQELNTDWYIKYYKNTLNREQELAILQNEVNLTIKRYQIYEAIFKSIFGIYYGTRQFSIIRESLPIYSEITEEQLTKLNNLIILPIFKGDYSFIKEKIEIPILNCTVWHSIEWIPAVCTLDYISKFPYRKYGDAKYPDLIYSFKLYNTVALDKKISMDMLYSFTGILDQNIQQITGLKLIDSIKNNPTNYTQKGINTAEEFVDAVYNAGEKIIEKIKEAAASIAAAASAAAASGSNLLNNVMIVGAVATVLFAGTYLFDND